MHYPKINSLWKRELDTGRKYLIADEYACEEFKNIKTWRVTEKIDGTNIRIIYRDGVVSIRGRTDDAQIPPKLLTFLQANFNDYTMDKHFPRVKDSDAYPSVILFGEGYGPKIQSCGGNYIDSPSFIFFDVHCQGWWLNRDGVADISNKFEMPHVPDLGLMTQEEIINFVKSKPLSTCSIKEQVMEGIVARTDPMLLFRDKTPLIFKLKCRDFE